jgi:hypothetical protein
MVARSNQPASFNAMAIVNGSSPVAQAALQIRKRAPGFLAAHCGNSVWTNARTGSI